MSKIFDKFRKSYDMRKWIIASLLSGFPARTFFYSRQKTSGYLRNYLDDQVHDILRDCELPVVKRYFHYSLDKYGKLTSEEAKWMLSVINDYGKCLGMGNCGFDFDYYTTNKTLEVAKEARRHLRKNDCIALRELGLKKLKLD